MVNSNELVSVIIPCFNAEKWLREAIDSALNQTHTSLEVIVIDDGSTDSSFEILKSYGSKVISRSGPNKGGNHARNQGFSLAKGQYIQYLDADDYLLPEKIKRQVEYLEESECDVVYGDWQHQYHYEDGRVILDSIKVTGEQRSLLASLLSGWWVSPACILFRREVVIKAGGWDESLTAGQDRDFFTSIVMSGAKVAYQPGCYSVYRRYGNVTVSTASHSRYIENHLKILEKNKRFLESKGRLDSKYKNALAQSYYMLARKHLDDNFGEYKRLLDKSFELSPKFSPELQNRTAFYKFSQSMIGFRMTEAFVVLVKRFRRFSLFS